MSIVADFKDFKDKTLKEDSDRRNALLDEFSQIDEELIETQILEQDGKVNYEIVEKRREEEIEKLKDISARMNDEAKNIREKWKKEGYIFE